MLKAGNHKSSQETKSAVLFTRASHQWELGKLRSAFRLFLSAAKAGDSSAQHNLGYFYDVGIGIKPNRAAALHWYKRAYRDGSRTAASNIATIFRDEDKISSALSWFQRAVRLGDADANLEIAKIYIGKGESRRAFPYLKRTINASSSDVTEGSKEEAQLLIKKATERMN